MQHDDLLLARNLNRNSCHNAFPRPQLLRTKLIPLKLSALALVIHMFGFAAATPASAQSPFTLRYSLFDTHTNVEAEAMHGYSVALDENTAVVGAPAHEYSFTFGVANIYDVATGRLLYTL